MEISGFRTFVNRTLEQAEWWPRSTVRAYVDWAYRAASHNSNIGSSGGVQQKGVQLQAFFCQRLIICFVRVAIAVVGFFKPDFLSSSRLKKENYDKLVTINGIFSVLREKRNPANLNEKKFETSQIWMWNGIYGRRCVSRDSYSFGARSVLLYTNLANVFWVCVLSVC